MWGGKGSYQSPKRVTKPHASHECYQQEGSIVKTFSVVRSAERYKKQTKFFYTCNTAGPVWRASRRRCCAQDAACPGKPGQGLFIMRDPQPAGATCRGPPPARRSNMPQPPPAKSSAKSDTPPVRARPTWSRQVLRISGWLLGLTAAAV